MIDETIFSNCGRQVKDWVSKCGRVLIGGEQQRDEGLETGLVWLNDIQRSSRYVPFGGMKESGLGHEKGRYGVGAYLEYKPNYLSYEVPL